MFLDVDDEIDENLFQKMQPYMEQDIEMIKYKMKIIKNLNQIDETKKENFFNAIELTDGPVFEQKNGQDSFNELCFNDRFLDSPCLYLIKKELFKRTKLKFEKNVYHEDFGLMPSLIVNAQSMVSTNYFGYYYFQTDESIMRNNSYEKEIKKVNDKFSLYTKLFKNLNNFEIERKTRENLLEYYTNSIILAIKDLDIKDRKDFEKRLKKRGLIKNIKVRNIKQFVKKIILKLNVELYFLLEK